MQLKVSNELARKCVTKIGEKINSPQQRLILGATALATQPFIDSKNKKVDKDTRAASIARTIAKIIAGTIVGVAVRAGSISLIKKYSNAELRTANGVTKIFKKSKNDIFVPLFAKIKPNITKEEFAKSYNKYVQTLGTLAATTAMVFTNFLLDAPFTKYLTNKILPTVKSSINSQEQKGGKV